jgi:putative chitinase
MGCTPALAVKYAAHIGEACALFDIVGNTRLAAFLAQIGHESGGLQWSRELWGPTGAQKRYEGRADLGNTQPGDGSRYRGRGLIQTTGRDNYRRVRDRLRAILPDVPDFEAAPEALEQPRWAALSAGDYWAMRGLNAIADSGDFVLLTRRINGGTNGLADRQARHKRALSALADIGTKSPQADTSTPKEAPMPLSAIAAALLPSLISAIPKLGKLFGSGSEVAERNVKAAELALNIAQETLGARSQQEAVETIQSNPEAAQEVRQAIESRWLELSEAGGDGIAGARKADAGTAASGDMLKSPSFWVGLALLPLVYLFVGSLIGLWGDASWSDDVRAGLAGSIVSAILGGLVGYYFGQTTSRNRTPAP